MAAFTYTGFSIILNCYSSDAPFKFVIVHGCILYFDLTEQELKTNGQLKIWQLVK